MAKNKEGKKKGSALFVIVMIILAGVFAVALYNVVNYYVTSSRNEAGFEELRELTEDTAEAENDEETIEVYFDDEGNVLTEEEYLKLAESGKVTVIEDEGLYPDESDGDKVLVKKVIKPSFLKLLRINRYFTGWITVPNTNIDYPVVHTPDEPEHYLRIDFNDEPATCGTPFVGDGCSTESDSFVIYGHNMNNDTMFGTLDYYKEEDFWKKNKEFTFSSLYEDNTYTVFAAFETEISSSAFPYYSFVGDLDKESFDELVENVKEASMYDTKLEPEYGQQLLMLSTCSYHSNSGRFVVIAYKNDDTKTDKKSK
ncbi:MAG: class B sortase [Clostridia bacterium]|nr:class B sortase [Clostridia bacterium]